MHEIIMITLEEVHVEKEGIEIGILNCFCRNLFVIAYLQV